MELKVQAIITAIERNANQSKFVAGQMKLHNILTQEVMSDDIISQLLSVLEIGTKAYAILRKERFGGESQKSSHQLFIGGTRRHFSVHINLKRKIKEHHLEKRRKTPK